MNNAPTANNMSTGNILKSYLVSIGINFDQEKLKDIQNRLKNFANNLKQAFLKPIEAIKNFASKFAEHFKKPLETIKNFAGKISKAFTDINKKIKAFMQTMQKAFTVISGFATAVISASLAVGKFMNTLAKQDLELDNFSRRMGVSKKTAREFKSAVDSLGASVEEIQFNPELFKQYKDLIADGRKMAVAGDYDKAMANVRSLGFEFVRLKNEANYVFQWVGYYLTKYLSGPMKEAKKYFQNFNEWIIKNTPQISAKIAEVMARIVDVFSSVFKFFGKVSTALSQWWGSQPSWVKNMMAGAGILGAIFLGAQNPLIAIGMVIAGIFLLIDDYIRWTEKRESAFGKIWAAITEACKKCKPIIEDWKKKAIEWFKQVKDNVLICWNELTKWWNENGPALQEFWQDFSKWIGDACNWGIQKIYELLDSLKDFMGKLGFFYAQVQTKGWKQATVDLISGQFDRDYEEAKQGNPNLNTNVSEDLIEQKMKEIKKDLNITQKIRLEMKKYGINNNIEAFENLLRNEAIHQLTQDGKIGPRRIQESFNAGVQASQALNNPPKPKGYNPQTDKYDHFINQAVYEVNQLAKEHPEKYAKVDPNLIKKIIAQESSFNEKAKNGQGKGLMQLEPGAVKDMGVKNVWDPKENILGGTKYISHLLKLYNEDVKNALYAYNGGMGNVDDFLKGDKNALNSITLAYPDAVLGQKVKYNPEASKYNANYFKASKDFTGITDRLVPIKQIDGKACGIVSVAMANNAINGNNNLTEDNIYSAYNYDLLRALNGTNKNKNIRWHDIQHDQGRYGQTKITDSDLKAMYEASKQGLPFIFGANGPKFSPSGYGHFMVGKKVDWEKQIVYYADPATGTIEHCTFKELKNAKQRLDGQGNPVFIPEYVGKQKVKQQTQINPKAQYLNEGQFMPLGNFGMMPLGNNFNPVPNSVNIEGINITINANTDNPQELARQVAESTTVALQDKMQFIGLSRNLGYGFA